jgi:hypothetical protein
MLAEAVVSTIFVEIANVIERGAAGAVHLAGSCGPAFRAGSTHPCFSGFTLPRRSDTRLLWFQTRGVQERGRDQHRFFDSGSRMTDGYRPASASVLNLRRSSTATGRSPRDEEEVKRGNHVAMILEEGQPSLPQLVTSEFVADTELHSARRRQS